MKHSIGLALAGIAFLTHSASADYNANMSGPVAAVVTYTSGDRILFRLSNQPTSHPQCNPAYFAIGDEIPQNRRNQAYAQLLAAKHTGEPINIGFDDTGDCANGYIRVHRIG